MMLTLPIFYPLQPRKITKKAQQKTKQTIISKFVRRSIRNDVFFSKRKLAGTGMMITESLIKRRMQLSKEAQQEFGVENTSTVKGNVHVSIKKKKHLIKCFEDIEILQFKSWTIPDYARVLNFRLYRINYNISQ